MHAFDPGEMFKLEKNSRVILKIKLNLNLHLKKSKSNKSFSREIDRIPQMLKIYDQTRVNNFSRQ